MKRNHSLFLEEREHVLCYSIRFPVKEVTVDVLTFCTTCIFFFFAMIDLNVFKSIKSCKGHWEQRAVDTSSPYYSMVRLIAPIVYLFMTPPLRAE